MYETKNVDVIIQESTVSFSEDYPEPKGKRLLDYWNGLRGERERPEWHEFNFSDIMDIASAVIVKDVIDGGREFQNRFWGTGNTDVVNFDGTGKFIANYYDPEHVDEILTLFRSALNNPAPMIMRGKNFYQLKTAWRPYSSVTVGFTDADGAVSQLVIAYDE